MLFRSAAEAKALGLEYAGCAWADHKAPLDEKQAREIIAVFNRAGAVLAKHGLKFFYHNHGFEFQKLGNETLMERFRRAPAAVTVHHAWIGGLLEHTLQLMKLADAMLPLYPALNRDLVLMGLFLHDLGKTAELEWEKGFSYTTEGNLIEIGRAHV